jgi:hypothetical protein
MFPDGVHRAPAMRSTQVEGLAETMMCGPSRPASLIGMGGPYEYAVHVEQHTADGDLDLVCGMDLNCTCVHRGRVSACTSLLHLIVGKEFRLLCGNTFPVQIRELGFPFLDQLKCLPVAPFGSGQHPFRMLSLSGLRI